MNERAILALSLAPIAIGIFGVAFSYLYLARPIDGRETRLNFFVYFQYLFQRRSAQRVAMAVVLVSIFSVPTFLWIIQEQAQTRDQKGGFVDSADDIFSKQLEGRGVFEKDGKRVGTITSVGFDRNGAATILWSLDKLPSDTSPYPYEISSPTSAFTWKQVQDGDHTFYDAIRSR